MIMTAAQRSTYYFRKEQQVRQAIRLRAQALYETARHQIDLRIRHYPRGMQAGYPLFVETLYKDMLSEDTIRQDLISQQQLYLRLAQAYAVEANRV